MCRSIVLLSTPQMRGVVGRGSRALYDRVGSDHLARNQVLTDAEMLQGALGLRAPELFSRHFDPTQAVGFCTKF